MRINEGVGNTCTTVPWNSLNCIVTPFKTCKFSSVINACFEWMSCHGLTSPQWFQHDWAVDLYSLHCLRLSVTANLLRLRFGWGISALLISSGKDYPLLGTIINVLGCQETSLTTRAEASFITEHQHGNTSPEMHVSRDNLFLVGAGGTRRRGAACSFIFVPSDI